MKNILKDRFIIVSVLMLLFGLVLLNSLIGLQIAGGDEYYQNSQQSIYRKQTTTAARGNILDRNGTAVAVSKLGYTVQIAKTDASVDEFNAGILKMAEILEKNGDSYSSGIGYYLVAAPALFQKSMDIINSWQTNVLGIAADKLFSSPAELFGYIRTNMFKINSSYTDAEAYKIMRVRYEIFLNRWSYSQYNLINISGNVSRTSVAEIEERHHELPGITTGTIPLREYINAENAAHIIGFVGQITQEQLTAWADKGYLGNEVVGATGIELSAQEILKGVDGTSEIMVNTQGRQTGVISCEPAVPGNNIILTIDLHLQKVAMESLEKTIKNIQQNTMKDAKNKGDANAGALVAIDIDTGELLAAASYPSYNPQSYLDINISKEAAEEVARLETDTVNRPLWNRTIQEKYSPGSTYKPIVGIAALEEGIIEAGTLIDDKGIVEIGGKKFYCLEYISGMGAHGRLSLVKALTTSCNIFFHIVGTRTTIDMIDKWAKSFGLGEKTGIELPYENSGIRSNKEYKMAATGEEWWIADTAQSSIGQLYNEFTPLQLANYVATIANGGKRYTPHIIKKVISYDGTLISETQQVYEQLPVSEETLRIIREGMRSVANSVDGTAVEVFADFPIDVAGKTGTAETGQEATSSSNALFVCYAPADNPRIAVAVVIEHGVWGSYAAPVAKDFLAAYFNIYGDNDTQMPAYNEFLP